MKYNLFSNIDMQKYLTAMDMTISQCVGSDWSSEGVQCQGPYSTVLKVPFLRWSWPVYEYSTSPHKSVQLLSHLDSAIKLVESEIDNFKKILQCTVLNSNFIFQNSCQFRQMTLVQSA